VPAATKSPEVSRLAGELRRQFGSEPLTVTALASELFDGDKAVAVLAAIEDALARATAADETDDLDEALWGLPPTDDEVADARRAGQAAVNEALPVALTGALSREEAAERLGISPQAVSKRLAARALVALSRGRTRWFPAWQFHEDGVLPGLADVIDAYPGTPLALTMWATTPSSDLDGAAPADVLVRRGGSARVVAAAHALSADAW
jgi:hypothetical protein